MKKTKLDSMFFLISPLLVGMSFPSDWVSFNHAYW